MLSLMISPTEPELTRRAFLFGGSAVAILALSGLGTTEPTRGFATLPSVSGYSATAGRFRRIATGFVRCAADEERLCLNPDGTFRGQYLQGADTYFSAPWDDPAAPHAASDPAFLSGDSANRIRYAGEHSEPDLFGTTGKGVVIRSEITNQFHTANNVALTGLVSGTLQRAHAIIALDGVTAPGVVELGFSGSAGGVQVFSHDASGVITGLTEVWGTRRAGFHDMGIINGKRWWYLWTDALATGTPNGLPRIGFGNVAAQVGKSLHLCELMLQKNPLTPPAAVPVCAVAKTFAADTLQTSFSNSGYVCEGLAMARSQIVGGAITVPAVNIGVPYEPLETRIPILPGIEEADRSGIISNRNEQLYQRPWRVPANFTAFFGPSFFPRNWLPVTLAGSNCVNASIVPVFQVREDLRPILGPHETSNTFLTGKLNVSKCIFLGVGDPRTKYNEQSDVRGTAAGSTFRMVAASDVIVEDALAVGGTLHSSRARRMVQQDDTREKQVYIGELGVQTAGGKLSVKGTRAHTMARVGIGALSAAANVQIDTRNFCATMFWMDGLNFGLFNATEWLAGPIFSALSTAHADMFFTQSERPVRISNDAGATWANLPPAFNPETMPHGFLGEHIGVWDFSTNTLTGAADPAKSLRVRYWEFDSIVSPAVPKPGFQWLASQMDYGDHTRLPQNGDVFRIKNGNQWIDVTHQGGYWTSGGYVRYVGAQIDNPLVISAAVSNDHIQITRESTNFPGPVVIDGCVMIGPKGSYFMTGNPGLPANGSAMDQFTIQNTFGLSDGGNFLRWDWSKSALARCTVQNLLQIEARSDNTLHNGQGGGLSSGTAGTNNVLTIGANVTAISSFPDGGFGLASSGASYVNYAGIKNYAAGMRSNYTDFTAPDPEVAQYLKAANYDAVQGRGVLPTYADLWDFNVTAFADTDAGFGVRAVITAARGNHARWNAVIEDLAAHYHREPDHYAKIPNSTAAGTAVATGVTATAFHARYSGNGDGYFSIVGGELRVARALTGLNRIFVMRGANNEMFVVDVTV